MLVVDADLIKDVCVANDAAFGKARALKQLSPLLGAWSCQRQLAMMHMSMLVGRSVPPRPA